MSNVKESVAALNEIAAEVESVTTNDGELQSVTLVGEGGFRVRITAENQSEWFEGHEYPSPFLKIERVNT